MNRPRYLRFEACALLLAWLTVRALLPSHATAADDPSDRWVGPWRSWGGRHLASPGESPVENWAFPMPITGKSVGVYQVFGTLASSREQGDELVGETGSTQGSRKSYDAWRVRWLANETFMFFGAHLDYDLSVRMFWEANTVAGLLARTNRAVPDRPWEGTHPDSIRYSSAITVSGLTPAIDLLPDVVTLQVDSLGTNSYRVHFGDPAQGFVVRQTNDFLYGKNYKFVGPVQSDVIEMRVQRAPGARLVVVYGRASYSGRQPSQLLSSHAYAVVSSPLPGYTPPPDPPRLAVVGGTGAGSSPTLTLDGTVDAIYSLECTDTLGLTPDWAELTRVALPTSPWVFQDPAVFSKPHRFYRAVAVDGQPANPDPANLVWVKPGQFAMGSGPDEPDRSVNEGPLTTVTLTKGFWIRMTEVTQDQYQTLIGTNPSGHTGEPTRPVENVTWGEATEYCRRLTERERAAGRVPAGQVYRLPTEAEWEYVCRAGTHTRFSHGDDPDYGQLGEYAWYTANSENQSHSVAGRKPNPWGLSDTHGNVWEWCLDWYAPNLPGGQVTDPKGPSDGAQRVLKGGSWRSLGKATRSAFRAGAAPETRSTSGGFRPVLAWPAP